jgi:hypothetical protein
MAWTNISNGLVAVGAKPFATTIQALRDNPIAIAEGATGAPPIHPAAMAMHRGFVNLSGNTPQEFLNLDRFKVLRGDGAFFAGTTSVSSAFQVRYSDDNGATWGSYQNIATTGTLFVSNGTASNRRDGIANFHLDLVTGAYQLRGVISEQNSGIPTATLAPSGTHTVPANCNAISFRIEGNAGTARIYLDALSGVAP